jgi:hypothetical protein
VERVEEDEIGCKRGRRGERLNTTGTEEEHRGHREIRGEREPLVRRGGEVV